MREDIIDRILDEALYIIENKATVRATAKVFHFSKSTVHKDVTDRLKEYDLLLYRQVKAVLDHNYKVRHIRGGEATRQKYLLIKNN